MGSLNTAAEWRREHACENFCKSVPEPHETPRSANQIFNAMQKPRFVNMRHVETLLEDLAVMGEVRVTVLPGRGRFRVYQWATSKTEKDRSTT
jgi:hypothetical protein